MDGRKMRESEVNMGHLMQPNQANVAGNVHGGEIMKLMDNTAGIVAHRHSRTNAVTARVDELEFMKPIHIGDYVTFRGKLTYVGSSSMEVLVEVFVEDLSKEGSPERALRGYFTMVALGEGNRPEKVPRLIVETEEEKKVFLEGEKRYRSHKEKKSRS